MPELVREIDALECSSFESIKPNLNTEFEGNPIVFRARLIHEKRLYGFSRLSRNLEDVIGFKEFTAEFCGK